MTPRNASSDRDESEDAAPGFMPIVRVAVAGIVAVFAAGVLVGFVSGVMDHGLKRPLVGALVVAAAPAVMFFAGRTVLRGVRALNAGPVAPRTAKARVALMGAVVLGVLLSVVMIAGGGESTDMLHANTPIPPVYAIAAIAVWAVATPLLSLYWWRNIDEHEAGAYRSSALAAMTAYAAITPSWWLAWRGGLAPEPQEMLTFLAVMTVWGAGWAWNRYR